MSKSIMHDKRTGTCWLCMKLHGDGSRHAVLQEHHVLFGSGLRKLSEKYGLKIYLCPRHHLYTDGPEAVHRNNQIRRYTEGEAQRAFEKCFPHLVFKDIFGKNVLDNEEGARQQAYGEKENREPGFLFIDNGIDGIDW